MRIENNRIKTEDNIELEVIKYIPKLPKGIIFMCHGLSVPKEGPKNILVDLAETLASNNFKVITFDFRGHGKSECKDTEFSIDGALRDLDAVIKNEDIKLPVGLFGFSCGAAVAITYAAINNLSLKAFVMFSPALEFVNASLNNPNSLIGQALTNAKNTSKYDTERCITLPNGFSIGREFIETADKYDIVNYMTNLDTKILILQSKRDQMLDSELMQSIGKPLADKYLVLDAVHALLEEKETAIAETLNWFNEYIK